MEADEIEVVALRHIAQQRIGPLFVSTVPGGPLISTDADEIVRLAVGGFPWSFDCANLVELTAVLNRIQLLDQISAIRVTDVPLYHGQEQVESGLFLYYRLQTQTLFAVPVMTTADAHKMPLN